MMRIGTVTNVYPDTGRVKVYYEDMESSSLPLPMVSFNREQSMPKVGEAVITLHMANGSSQGFCLGTYFDEDFHGSDKYKKEFDDKAFAECDKGKYKLKSEDIKLETKKAVIKGTDVIIEAEEITLKGAAGSITLSELLKKLADHERRLDDHEKRIAALESKI